MTAAVIVSFRPSHRDAFRSLNLAWIEDLFSVESRDRDELDRPEDTILAPGGQIFIAERDGVAVVGLAMTLPLAP